jgi:hypothetical protein
MSNQIENSLQSEKQTNTLFAHRVVVETNDWKLDAFIDWMPKSHSEECPYCHGAGEVGGGFKSLDGARECPTCFGRGSVTKGPTTPKPEIPPALREHMRRAWFDFMYANSMQKTD